MLEKVIELLTTLVVALAGIAGVSTAAEHAAPPADPPGLETATLAEETAALRARVGLARAAEARAEAEAGLQAVDGLATATEALTQAMELAPEQADPGLDRALEAVTTAPANDGPAAPLAVPPVDIPVGPPDDLPGPPEDRPGPPEDLPGGRP